MTPSMCFIPMRARQTPDRIQIVLTSVIRGLIQTLERLVGNEDINCWFCAAVARAPLLLARTSRRWQVSMPRAAAPSSAVCATLQRQPSFPGPHRAPGGSYSGGWPGTGRWSDLRIAANCTVVGMPEIKVRTPSVIHAAIMPSQIGTTLPTWILLTGENIGAMQARATGASSASACRRTGSTRGSRWSRMGSRRPGGRCGASIAFALPLGNRDSRRSGRKQGGGVR